MKRYSVQHARFWWPPLETVILHSKYVCTPQSVVWSRPCRIDARVAPSGIRPLHLRWETIGLSFKFIFTLPSLLCPCLGLALSIKCKKALSWHLPLPLTITLVHYYVDIASASPYTSSRQLHLIKAPLQVQVPRPRSNSQCWSVHIEQYF